MFYAIALIATVLAHKRDKLRNYEESTTTSILPTTTTAPTSNALAVVAPELVTKKKCKKRKTVAAPKITPKPSYESMPAPAPNPAPPKPKPKPPVQTYRAPAPAPVYKAPAPAPSPVYKAPAPVQNSAPVTQPPKPAPAPVMYTVANPSCLDLHNKARAEVGLPPITYSSKLAESAEHYSQDLSRRFGDSITLVHSTGQYGSVGENLYANTGGSTCAGAMDYWVGKEKPLYRVGTAVDGPGFKEYGHYTQIVNRQVKQVGCSTETTGTNKRCYFVCHYDAMQIGTAPAY